MNNFNNIFGIHETTVKFRAQRAEVLANNIANADTPGFKAKDLDFSQVIKQYESGMDASSTKNHNNHVDMPSLNQFQEVYRNPLQQSLDGNTVDSQVEVSKFTENSIRYEASLSFLSSRIKGMITALRGQP